MPEDKRKIIHDIRNPLNNISVNAELGKLLLDRTGDTAKAQEIFSTILQECKACSLELDKLKSILEDQQGMQ